jgi:flotillin
MDPLVALLLGVPVIAAVGVALGLALAYRKVGPNEVLIISGRRARYLDRETGDSVDKSFAVLHGGGTLVWPIREKVDRMSVELMTLEILTPEFFTKFGVPIVVDGIAQIKVRSDDPVALATAAEMFLSKSAQEMNEIAHQMMQGHLRAVISTLPFEEIHANPEAFAQTVQRLTAEDLANMGIQVVSFTIREVQDPNGYLQALGRPQLAEVQKNALVGEANAQRDASVGQATAEREASVTRAKAQQDARLAQVSAEVEVARSESARDAELHQLASQVSEAKARSDVSYDLQAVRSRQALLEGQLALRALELARTERDLVEKVVQPAEAEARKSVALAEASRQVEFIQAQADADAERARGLARAEVIRATGEAEAHATRERCSAEAEGLRARLLAEAEGMRAKSAAGQIGGSLALTEQLIARLPEIATAIATPLGRIDRIVMVGGTGESGASAGIEGLTRSVTKVVAELPPMLEALTGIDLTAAIAGLQAAGATPRRLGGEVTSAEAARDVAIEHGHGT